MQALDIKNLKKTYQNGVVALKGIDLQVEEGDFFALLGPNGAGKTTIIGILTSLVNKTSGQVAIFNHNLDNEPVLAKSFLGVVPQEFNFNFFEKGIDIVVNQAGYYGIPRKIALERAEYYLNKLSLWEKRNHASRLLSGGMKRRLMLVRALIHQPKMLILDEPSAGVDIELRRSLWIFLRELNESGTTIILTTHYLEEAESLCKGIAIINHGNIVARNTVKNILSEGLRTETLLLDLKDPILEAPYIPDCDSELKDPSTLEITFPKSKHLNDIFDCLSQKNIQVVSLRNKTNRLEELFLHLTQKSQTDDGSKRS